MEIDINRKFVSKSGRQEKQNKLRLIVLLYCIIIIVLVLEFSFLDFLYI